MKRCSKCKTFYEKDLFTKNNLNKDKLNSWCRNCTRKSSYNCYLKNRKKRLEQTKEYGKTPKGKEVAKKAVRKWNAKNRKARLAYMGVGIAVRAGLLIPLPCEKCGKKESQAHHEDYDKPYVVLWLCVKCHNDHHSKKKIINKD